MMNVGSLFKEDTRAIHYASAVTEVVTLWEKNIKLEILRSYGVHEIDVCMIRKHQNVDTY